jgi:hypothetical protein
MIYIRPIPPDKYQICSSLFGLFANSLVTMREGFVLPPNLKARVDQHLRVQQFGLFSKWACRITAYDAIAILSSNMDADVAIRLPLFRLLEPLVRLEIRKQSMKGYSLPTAEQTLTDFIANLGNSTDRTCE